MAESNRSDRPMDIHVLVEAFPQQLRRRVLDSLPPGAAGIRWIDADVSRFTAFATLDHISRMTFARLLIPEVVPAGTPRLVYLDADILVLDDLSPLWTVDLAGQPIGAIADPVDALIKANPARYPNVPRVASYFNAGVLVVDVERWREERISDKAFEYLLSFPSTAYSDQDALNVACDGRWKALDTRWNYQGHLDGRIEDLDGPRAPAVVHFVTTMKPWKPASLSVNAALYDSFRRRTQFARTPLNIVSDALQSFWCRAMRFLRHVPVLRAMRNRLGMIASRPVQAEKGG